MSERCLPDHAYALFEAKGPENAARVRRIVRLIAEACGRSRDWRGLRVLDLGCGEGLFALEAALHGNAQLGTASVYGKRYLIDFNLLRNERVIRIRSTWMIRVDDHLPRLTSCYVI